MGMCEVETQPILEYMPRWSIDIYRTSVTGSPLDTDEFTYERDSLQRIV